MYFSSLQRLKVYFGNIFGTQKNDRKRDHGSRGVVRILSRGGLHFFLSWRGSAPIRA